MELPNEPTNAPAEPEHDDATPMVPAESSLETNSGDVHQEQLTDEPSYSALETRDDFLPHDLKTGDYLPTTNEVTPTVRPGYKLYSPSRVAIAAFLGGILSAALLIAHNYWVLRRRSIAILVLLIGVAVPLVMAGIPHNLPHNWFVWAAVMSAVSGTAAKLMQGHFLRQHVAEDGKFASGLGAFGWGILGAFLTIGLIDGVYGVDSLVPHRAGNRLVVTRDSDIYYVDGATREEAQKLGEFLKNDKWFEEGTPQTLILARSGSDFLISIFFDHGVWDDVELLKYYEGYASKLSGDVFDGRPVQFLFRKTNNNQIMHRLAAKTGVSRREFQKHVNAANLAFESQDYPATERHYRAAVAEAEKHESLKVDLVRSLNNVGRYRLVQSITDDVDTWFQRAIKLGSIACGPNSYEVGYALDGLGDWELARGNLPESEEFYRRALSIRKTLGAGHRDDYLRTLESLIDVLISQEKLAPAEVLQKQLVTLAGESSGVGSAEAASHMSRLGWLQCKTGKLTEAKETLTQSLKMIEKLPQESDFGHWMCLWRLGQICHAFGEDVDAEKHLRRGIELLEDSDQDLKLLKASFNSLLAEVLVKQARYDESEQLFRQALEIQEQELGLEHVEVADSLGHLGTLASSLGHYTEAESQLKRAIDILEKSAERDQQRARIADCLYGLALLYHTQGRYAEAEPLYRRVITIREDVLGNDHYEVAAALGSFSKLYSDRGDYVPAERLARESHQLLEKILGTTNPYLVRSLHRLALAQDGQRKLRDAEETLHRALEIGDKNPGSDPLQIAEVKNSLAANFLQRSRPEDAEPLLEQAIAIFETTIGPDHPGLSGPLNNLGLVYYDRGELLKAETCLARSLKLAERRVGPDHPYLLYVLFNYESVLRQLNRKSDADDIARRREAIEAKGVPKDKEINATSKPVVL